MNAPQPTPNPMQNPGHPMSQHTPAQPPAMQSYYVPQSEQRPDGNSKSAMIGLGIAGGGLLIAVLGIVLTSGGSSNSNAAPVRNAYSEQMDTMREAMKMAKEAQQMQKERMELLRQQMEMDREQMSTGILPPGGQ